MTDKQKDNIIPHQVQSGSEARKKGRAGGIASGIARRQKKTMRELLALAFEDIITNPTTKESKTRKELAMARLAAKCANGDLKAIELAAKLAGEFKERHELTGADGEPIQLQAMPPKKLTKAEMRVALEELKADL